VSLRNPLRYVASKNQKEFMKDLKLVYQAVSKEVAEMELDNLESKWEHLSAYFKYSEEIRRIIYTTNTIELVHRQF